ncbi:PIG-L family deacetylase [Kineococcus sp. NUM-3379]
MPVTVRTQSMAAPAGVVSPAVFLVPHQDDETLTMGPAIEEHVNTGAHVVVVLVTDGKASGARRLTPLTVEEFSAARDREFLAACAALGVPEEQVFLAHGPDGALRTELARHVVGTWVHLFPAGRFRTTTWTDAHPDHAALGVALREHAASLDDVRFYVKPDEWDAERPRPALRSERTATRRYLAACDEYGRVDHPAGRWGIGMLSVPGVFARRRASDESRWHAAG